ncbi:MAG: glycosyltransferase family 4 protein [Candidatus Omnitrophica bacterium]|nr:glycosyltransferase family 4 protein [Candidatus Omnitrophota bacterium]
MKQPIRVLALTLYPDQFSSRIRIGFFKEPLRDLGVEMEISPPISREQFDREYLGDRQERFHYHLTELRNRTKQLHLAQKYDILWIQKGLALFPWRTLGLCKTLFANRVVVDIDDDVVDSPPVDVRGWRRILGTSMQMTQAIGSADWVLAGSKELADSLAKLNPRVEVFPSTIPLSRVSRSNNPRGVESGPTLIWIGTASNRKYLNLIGASLSRLSEKIPGLSLRVISDGLAGIDLESFNPCPVVLETWTPETEYEALSKGWVGVIPLDRSEWAQRKGGYKILQYFAAGLPTVGSSVGANNDLILPGVNGYLADSPKDWEQCLHRLLTDPSQRITFGLAGQQLVKNEYSTEGQAEKLAALFKKLAGRPRF